MFLRIKKNSMEKEIKKINTILDIDCSKIELENEILIATWKNTFINLTIAKNAVIRRLEVTSGQKYPVLLKIKSIKNTTKEARDFLASEKGCEEIIAAAILINSFLGSMIANFWMKINKTFKTN